jgi:hypothetical protein
MAHKQRRTLIRTGKVKTGIVTDGQSIQPIARISPHNANKKYLIPNRFVKKVDA